MYEIYMRDTPPNDPSQASQAENSNDSDKFHGTEENTGTCPKASQEEEKESLGRNGTCPANQTRPTEHIDNSHESGVGRMGREESGGIPEKNINFLSGEEVEL
jgi:hypothetical protein